MPSSTNWLFQPIVAPMQPILEHVWLLAVGLIGLLALACMFYGTVAVAAYVARAMFAIAYDAVRIVLMGGLGYYAYLAWWQATSFFALATIIVIAQAKLAFAPSFIARRASSTKSTESTFGGVREFFSRMGYGLQRMKPANQPPSSLGVRRGDQITQAS